MGLKCDYRWIEWTRQLLPTSLMELSCIIVHSDQRDVLVQNVDTMCPIIFLQFSRSFKGEEVSKMIFFVV